MLLCGDFIEDFIEARGWLHNSITFRFNASQTPFLSNEKNKIHNFFERKFFLQLQLQNNLEPYYLLLHLAFFCR